MLTDIWDWFVDKAEGIVDFFSTIGDFFSNIGEIIPDDTPLTNLWFWTFYVCLMAGVWYLPSAMGLSDYSLVEKLLYSAIFFVIDFFIVRHFME